jgi:hypothetical protein
MPDIVITPNRGTSNNPKIDFTGTSAGTIKLEVLADGSIAWNGTNGSLFSIADSLSGSLMSVNDISGLPAFEVFSDNRVIVGQFGANLLLGKTTSSSNGRLQLATHTTVAGGIGFGTDIGLYRLASNKLSFRGTADAEMSLRFERTGGSFTTTWENYIPVGSTDLKWFNGADKFTLTASGNATFSGYVVSTSGFATSGIYNYAFLQTTDSNNFWITPGNNQWGLYFETSAGGLLGGTGDSNRLGFVGNATARFYVDLNNGNGWFGGTATATQLISNVAQGTAPLVVTSTTQVSNLNAQYLNGYSSDTANTANAIVRRDGSGNFSAGTITATLAGLATSETLSTVTGRGASTGSQISVSSGSAGSMFTGTKVGSGYSDGVSGATFKSILDNPNGGSGFALVSYYGGSGGTLGASIRADGYAYFKEDVGIGTNSPSGKLDVRVAGTGTWDRFIVTTTTSWGDGSTQYVTIGAGGAAGIMLSNPHVVWNSGNSAAGIRMGRSGGISSGAWYEVGTGTSDSFHIKKEGTTRLYIDTNGNVGIGTTSPSYKLHVEGDSYSSTGFYVRNSAATFIGSTNNMSGISVNGTSYDTFIVSGGNQTITVKSGGNVGINQTAPSYKLDVNGEGAFVSNSSARVLYLKQNAANTGNIIQFRNEAGGDIWELVGRNTQFYIYNTSLSQYSFYIAPATGNVGISTSSPAYKLDVSGTLRSTTDAYFATSSGSVGIGNTSPSYKLHVSGDIYANGGWFRVSGNQGYYFETHGGGWYMTDSTWLRAYNDKAIITNNEIRGTIFVDANNTGYYVDPASSSVLNYVGAGNIYDNAQTRYVSPGGGTYVTSVSSVAGAIRIRLPAGRRNSSTMLRFTVKVYEYSTGRSHTFDIGGYNYGAGNWYNIFATQLTDTGRAAMNVRFGDDGSNDFITIGETSDSWSYPQVYITDVQTGYSGFSTGWGENWIIDFVTSFSGVEQTRTAALVKTSNNASSWAYADYATIFYDSNDTNYYIDPASTSRVNTVSFVSGSTFGPYLQYSNQNNLRLQGGSNTTEVGLVGYDFNGNWRFQLYGGGSGYGFLNGNWAGWDIQKVTSGNLYLNNQTTYYIGTNEIYYNRVYGLADIRSPIFYDNDNTAYYIDGNSTSYLNSLYLYGGLTTTGNTRLGQSSGTTTRIDDILQVGASDSGDSHLYFGEDTSSWYGAHWYWDSGYTHYWYSRNGGTDSTLMQYATNDTTKITFGRNIEFNNYGKGIIGTYASTRYQGVFAMGESYKLPDDGTGVGTLYGIAWSHPNAGGAAGNLASHGMLILENGTFKGAWGGGRLVTTSDIRGTVFYDYDNTGYYVDPTGNANIANSVYVGGWFRNYGNQGLYNETHGNHWYATGNDYWNLAGNNASNIGIILRSGGHQGTIRGYVYADSNNHIGFLNNGGSWRLRVVSGDYTLAEGSSIRGQLFYDSNDTNYYVDPANGGFYLRGGTSNRVTFSTTDSGIFVANAEGGGTTVRLGAAWGCPGVYNTTSLTLGAESNIEFRIASAQKGYIDSSSNLFAFGSMRSPIFYDYDNTGYYVDPASTSNLNRLLIQPRNDNYYVGTVSYVNSVSDWQSLTNTTGQFTVTQMNNFAAGGFSNYPSSVYTYGSVLSWRTEYHSFQLYAAHTGDITYKTQWANDNYSGWLYPMVYGRVNGGGGSIYGTIFYDQNNSNYYCDPASTSRFNTVDFGTSGYYIGAGDWGMRHTTPYGWIQFGPANASWAHIYASQSIYFNTNTYVNGNWMLYENAWQNGKYFESSGVIYSQASMRAPIFYDYNNTAYYFDGASTSVANNVQITTLGVGTAASGTAGEIRATNNITAYYSDERLKTKLGKIEDPIAKVKSLSGFYFEANETAVALGYDKKREVGVSAQEVQAVLPEIIAPAPISDKYMTVRYEKLIPLLIEAIKEQQNQIEQLSNELKSLKNKL